MLTVEEIEMRATEASLSSFDIVNSYIKAMPRP
jgi:hypothetical protein